MAPQRKDTSWIWLGLHGRGVRSRRPLGRSAADNHLAPTACVQILRTHPFLSPQHGSSRVGGAQATMIGIVCNSLELSAASGKLGRPLAATPPPPGSSELCFGSQKAYRHAKRPGCPGGMVMTRTDGDHVPRDAQIRPFLKVAAFRKARQLRTSGSARSPRGACDPVIIHQRDAYGRQGVRKGERRRATPRLDGEPWFHRSCPQEIVLSWIHGPNEQAR